MPRFAPGVEVYHKQSMAIGRVVSVRGDSLTVHLSERMADQVWGVSEVEVYDHEKVARIIQGKDS